jgi:hypothetical protein
VIVGGTVEEPAGEDMPDAHFLCCSASVEVDHENMRLVEGVRQLLRYAIVEGDTFGWPFV